jgi:acetyl-CoA carboxylase biotin carboxylase subunit
VGKLIVWGKDRPETIERMKRTLSEFCIEGVKTTIPFHQKVMQDEDFIKGDFNTHFLEKFEEGRS